MTTMNYLAAAKILEFQVDYLINKDSRADVQVLRDAVDLNWPVWDSYIQQLGALSCTVELAKLHDLYLTIKCNSRPLPGAGGVTEYNNQLYKSMRHYKFHERLLKSMTSLREIMLVLGDMKALELDKEQSTSPVKPITPIRDTISEIDFVAPDLESRVTVVKTGGSP